MNISAGKVELTFEPKMRVPADVTGKTETHKVMRPTLGPVANLRNYTAKISLLARVEGAATTGTVVFRLKDGAETIWEHETGLNGISAAGVQEVVSLYNVNGGQRLFIEADVTGAADSGVVLTVDAKVDIDLPVVMSGC